MHQAHRNLGALKYGHVIGEEIVKAGAFLLVLDAEIIPYCTILISEWDQDSNIKSYVDYTYTSKIRGVYISS